MDSGCSMSGLPVELASSTVTQQTPQTKDPVTIPIPPRIDFPGGSPLEHSPGVDRASDSEDDAQNAGFDPDSYQTVDHITQNSSEQTLASKRRQDASIFHNWLAQSQHEINARAESAAENTSDKSTLDGSFESRRIIETPREYQIDLFERSKSKNTIVVLDTGAGKTLIAVLLLRHTLDQELERRARGYERKTSFFIVEKVALCFQQHKVLESNLDHRVSKIYGDMAGIVNTREYWEHQFSKNMAIVTTAQVLLGCLGNGFISMRQINLLVFDEAHHAKKNHPFAKIIKSHYLREPDVHSRPRILGMTASPVDAQTRDMRAAAAELESMLCGEISTVSNEILIRTLQERKLVESTEYYKALTPPEESRTALWDEIYPYSSSNPLFGNILESTLAASSTLGPWCADRYWSLLFDGSEVPNLVARSESDVEGRTTDGINEAVSAVHLVQRKIQAHHFQPASRAPANISPKVEALLHILDSEFRDNGATRCIVFVEKRYTAVLLADLLQQPGMRIPGIIPSYMVGSQTVTSSIASMTFREQVAALVNFRNGSTNCLFATPVGEEGIDIPACDLVVRFDMYNTVIQYIQSRGRARQVCSRFISMIEEGNMRELRRLKQAMRDSTALQKFCSALPEDRKVQDPILIDIATLAEAERISQKTYEIASTSARLSFENSMDILARFTSSLATPGDNNLCPEYAVTPMDKKFVADVILPESSPVICLSGFPQRSKQLARFSAAYEACLVLLEKRYLDDHLQPAFTKRLPAMRNARLALGSGREERYERQTKPKIWSDLASTSPLNFFTMACAMESPQTMGKQTRPLIILTRKKLPPIPDTPLFFGNGSSSLLKLVSPSAPITLSPGQVEALLSFTLKIFEDIFSKSYEVQAAEMPLFLAPCAESHGEILEKGAHEIFWGFLHEICDHPFLKWEKQDEDFFHDKLVIDPFDGSRKFFIHGMHPGLKPSDPTPSYAPMPQSRSYRSVTANIKEYSNSLYMKARERAQWKDDQPVVYAEIISLRRNFLSQFDLREHEQNRCCIILEPLKISSIPVDVANMALFLPSVLHHIDSALITMDACAAIGLDIRPDLALDALTKDCGGEQSDGQETKYISHGPTTGGDYERLEFLGDTFLKMATTISLFTQFPGMNEYEYHVERMLLVSNKNLLTHGVELGLPQFIRSKGFDRRSWYPNLKLKKGKAPRLKTSHHLADKSIADVCEALIGAAYLSPGTGDMDLATKAVTKLVGSKNHTMESFEDYYAAYRTPEWQSMGRVTQAQRVAVEAVREKTGYSFRSPALLRSAFKHPAYTYEMSIPNYQRLEFLGDALLDMAVVDYLFRQFPAADPQWLTEHKMAMVSNQFLGFLCVHLDLHRHILVTTSALVGQRAEYVADIERVRVAATSGKGDNEQRPRAGFWTEASQPPKALADVMEAVVGAMFVDSQYDYGVVQEFFRSHILPHFADMALYDSFAARHPVTALSKILQGEVQCRNWRLCSAEMPCGIEQGAKAVTESEAVCALLIHGKVVEHATAKSERYAKLACAKKACKRLGDMDREGYSATFGCDCAGEAEGR